MPVFELLSLRGPEFSSSDRIRPGPEILAEYSVLSRVEAVNNAAWGRIASAERALSGGSARAASWGFQIKT